jgi:hypothetical protein
MTLQNFHVCEAWSHMVRRPGTHAPILDEGDQAALAFGFRFAETPNRLRNAKEEQMMNLETPDFD